MNTTKSSGSISAYKSPTTSSNGLRKSFGPDGCPALVDGSRCGETKNLQIIKEFKRLYEDKMKQIDDIAGGDCIQAKVNLQQEWIKDLTDQNEMLVRVVEELEVEAAERVTLLEKKLHQSAKSAGEVMDSYRDFSINFLGDLQKMEQVQNDMNNLIELIRRAQTTGNWNTDGLMFYCLDINDVIPPCARRVCVPSCCNSVKKEDLIKQQEKRIKELEAQLKPQESYRKDYKDLEQSMLDMRDALTAEVADKHDTILCLRREVHMLEEQCRKADQQTHFKDDIIKELRKEIKQLKQQQQTPNEQSTEKIQLKEAVLDIKNQLAIMKDNLAACAKERDHYRREAESARQECQCQCGHIKELRNRLQSSMEQVHRIQEEKIQENEELRGMLKESFEENQNLKEEMDHGVKEYKQKIQDYCCCNEELNRQLVLSKSDVEECQCQILLLKKEKERLETCQNNDVLKEIESFENQHKETINQLELLRAELEKTKRDHKLCMDKIQDLCEENTILKERCSCIPQQHKSTEIDISSCCCVNADASVNTDSTWTGVLSIDEVGCVSVAINTSAVNQHEVGFSSDVPLMSSDAKCIQCCDGNLNDKKQMDTYTCVNSYIDTEKSDDDLQILGVCRPVKKLRVTEPLDHMRKQILQQKKVSLSTSIPRKLEGIATILNEEIALLDRLDGLGPAPTCCYDRRCILNRGTVLSSDVMGVDSEEMDIPCGSPEIPGITKECKKLKFALSNHVKGNRNQVQAIRDNSPCGQNFYPPPIPQIPNPIKSSLKQPLRAVTQTRRTPQPQRKCLCNAVCQTCIKQRDVSVIARPVRRLKAATTQIVGFSKSLSVETATSMDNNYKSTKSSATTTSSSLTTESGDSYEDTVLSRSKDHVIYVRQSNPTQDLEAVVHDLNLSVSRIAQIAEEDPKEKIARLEEQLRTLQQKEQAIEYERLRRGQEVENLKLTIQHMEHAIKNKQANSENLQCAVDLYNDSISVLEQSKLSYETQITQQQMTITNLQDALIITKKELEELRIKFKQDHEHKCDLLNILDIGVYDLESSSLHYHNELKTLKSTIEVLTEENLNLEITKFEINQDKTILETTLFNYKQEEKRLFEFINNLKEEISRLKHESRNDALKIASLQNEVTSYLTQSIETKTIMKHILGIGDTEDPTIDCDCSGNSLTMTAQEVERFVQTLQSQINLMLASIEREQNLSQVNAGRIDELQNILSLKNMELARSIEMYDDLKEKLDDFACRNKKLQDAVIELRDQLVDTELDQQFHEQKVDYCHDELDNCLKNLNSVKCRLNHQTQEMTKKIEELQGLKTDFKEQNNTLEKYKRELDGTKIKYRDEVLEMKRVIKELNEKLNYSDLKVKEVTEELKGVQEMLVNMTQRETKYQQELTGKDQDLNNKCQVWKVKETRLMEQISQLEQQLRAVHNELAGRTHQIDSTKSKLQQVTNDAQMRMQMTQEELITAKNEINCLRQINEKLQIENENLHQTVCSLQSTLGQHESLNITIKKQLDKCMCDLKKIESDKYFVEQKNEKLLQELDKMQSLLRCRCENVMTLEEEINDIKSDRDEIRRESQHVICNVRAWLEEQKRLNDQLKDKLVKKNALIIKYQQSSSSPIRPPLKKSLPPVCAEALNRRQRGGTTAISSRNLSGMNVYKRLSSPQRVWSLNSKGSDTEDSPRSSICSDSADWFDMDASETTTTPYDEPGTAVWIQRVESMTEELQKTNRYWKKKISDNEKEEERLKKTKET
ncbi:putative leucine-rich repeat-containing protein DDB_G0290503 isoform X2 [Onthophagus taurus]|uniref:putative leucine-rich repeat-containing protein DDB_G0290503 isoform X2 n=1 Tax=Onthophagus taurus TaxID=166361 RepID=UPI0039BE0A35